MADEVVHPFPGGSAMAGPVDMHVLTDVSATVAPSRWGELVDAFEALIAEGLPEGLLRTELVQAGEVWRIQSLWRDRDALAAMRAGTEEPAAPRLFRSVGGEPELRVLDVRVTTGV